MTQWVDRPLAAATWQDELPAGAIALATEDDMFLMTEDGLFLLIEQFGSPTDWSHKATSAQIWTEIPAVTQDEP